VRDKTLAATVKVGESGTVLFCL